MMAEHYDFADFDEFIEDDEPVVEDMGFSVVEFDEDGAQVYTNLDPRYFLEV